MTSTTKLKPSHIVGIGASAGGLEAIESFFRHMPADSGLAFVVIQHLSPDYKSLMTELLSKRTPMKVHRAEENMEIQANNVYLIPPKKNLTIFHGKLLLSDQDLESHNLNLPIDIFFRSLAEDQGEKAIAIVLSGTGSDGTRGVRAIKESNGMVMVQDEESAKFDGMPRSAIATRIADYVLPPDKMPEQLAGYIEHPYVSQREPIHPSTLESEEESMVKIYALLREHSRIDFTYYKPATVVRRLQRRMTINQINELRDYVHYLRSHRSEVDILYHELLIGVTSFFRDIEAFDLLQKNYLPALVREVENREIRVWIAGCSTGEEAYTVAILLQETMESLGLNHDIKIFATDVDLNAIEFASVGRYAESIVNDVPLHLLNKYFTRQEDGRYQIRRHLREKVVFAQHNLVKDPPFTNIDLVSCRNLLIYLQSILQQKVLELFNFSLRPGGILFLGSSETTGDMTDYFDPLQQKWRIYCSKGKRKASGIELGAGSREHGRILRNRLAGKQAASRLLQEEERVLDRYLQSFAQDYVRFSMIVDSDLELIHAIGDTREFLQMQPGLMSSDASKLIIKELSIPLSTGTQKVLKTGEPMIFSKIRVTIGSESKLLQMRIKQLSTKKGQEPLIGIYVNDMQQRSGADLDSHDNQTYDFSAEAEDRITDLEQELQFTRENLQATVEELETSNEELQATNEELLASNEELQSTNEELQSVNEELYTVNGEYQSKITELTELTNDLDNLLSSTNIGTLFLDEDLNVRRFSFKATELFNLIESDLGRPIHHISHQLKDIDLATLARQVLKSESMFEREFESQDNRHYMLRAIPYRISSDTYAGVLIMCIDITAYKRIQNELKVSHKAFRQSVQSLRFGTWDWNISTGKAIWSKGMKDIFGVDEPYHTAEETAKIVIAEDRQRMLDAVNHAIETGENYAMIYRIKNPQGEIRTIFAFGEIEKDRNGKILSMRGSCQDLTMVEEISHEDS